MKQPATSPYSFLGSQHLLQRYNTDHETNEAKWRLSRVINSDNQSLTNVNIISIYRWLISSRKMMFVKSLWDEIYFQYYLQRDLISFSLYWELIKDSQDVLRVLLVGPERSSFSKEKINNFPLWDLFLKVFWSHGPGGVSCGTLAHVGP